MRRAPGLIKWHISWKTTSTISHPLNHWGWVRHKCVSKLTIIGSENRLSPRRRQAIIWTNAYILSIGPPLGTNFSEILIEIYTFLFKKMHLKMSSGQLRPFCHGLNMLRWRQLQNEAYAEWSQCRRRHFQTHFHECQMYIDWNFIEVCPWGLHLVLRLIDVMTNTTNHYRGYVLYCAQL